MGVIVGVGVMDGVDELVAEAVGGGVVDGVAVAGSGVLVWVGVAVGGATVGILTVITWLG